MIADERHINFSLANPALTYSEGKFVSCILNCMKLAVNSFLQVYKSTQSRIPMNEDDLTQIFYSQVQIIVREFDYPFNIGNQERDLTKQRKGIPDLFFYAHKLGKPPISIFSIECKRLPAPPPKSREKEYVIGVKNNGGIERYKTEKHGKGLDECGMLGFVEEETFPFWQKCINTWIINLSNTDFFWQNDEILVEVENRKVFAVLQSIAHRVSQTDIRLHHLWINIQ